MCNQTTIKEVSVDKLMMNSSNGTGNETLYYDKSYSAVSMTLYTIILVCGMLGNVMVICVISRSKIMRTATNCYLLSLAVADCVILMSATLPAIAEPFFQIKEWPWGRVMCSVLVFLQYLGINASTFSIAAFTVERYIGICHPMKAHVICSVSRAKRIIAVLWILSVAYCSPWLGLTFTFTVTSGGKEIDICYFRLERNQYLAYYLTDLVLFYVIPLLIAAVMYGCIARTLFKTMTGHGPLLNTRRESNIPKNGQNRTNSKVQVVRMLIVIVSVFALTWLPYRTLVVYNSLSLTAFLNKWYLLFCRSLIYTNSAINPVLYSAMSVKFRRAFRNCLCCKQVPRSPTVVNCPRSGMTETGRRKQLNIECQRQSIIASSKSNSSAPSFETQLIVRQASCNVLVFGNVILAKGTTM